MLLLELVWFSVADPTTPSLERERERERVCEYACRVGVLYSRQPCLMKGLPSGSCSMTASPTARPHPSVCCCPH